MMTENLENTPFIIQGFPNLIREDGRTIKSGRDATIFWRKIFYRVKHYSYPRHFNAGDTIFHGKGTFTLVFTHSESATPARYSKYYCSAHLNF